MIVLINIIQNITAVFVSIKPNTCTNIYKISFYISQVLRHAGLSCANIPVLSFRFVNKEDLKTNLSAMHLFSAIIFTSVRAVEAVVDSMQGICKPQIKLHREVYASLRKSPSSENKIII